MNGSVVVLPFPFSDLTASKRRPALIVATMKGDDIILCQITSRLVEDDHSVLLTADDFREGRLDSKSTIKLNRLFTADRSIVLYKIGSLKESKIKEVEAGIVKMFKA